MFHSHLWFGTTSLGDLTIGQLAFITDGLNRKFEEEAKAWRKAGRRR